MQILWLLNFGQKVHIVCRIIVRILIKIISDGEISLELTVPEFHSCQRYKVDKKIFAYIKRYLPNLS